MLCKCRKSGHWAGMVETLVLHKCGLIPSVVHRGGNTNTRDSILCGGIRMYFCNI